jgi:parvulin-like peptidyl-prolyl isomerase
MKKFVFVGLIYLLLMGPLGNTFGGELPVIDGKIAVATVNDEPITLEELNDALAESHAERSGEGEAGRIDYSQIMKRLINTRLILLEAENIGFYEVPEVKRAVEKYSEEILMKFLLAEHVKDIHVTDEEVTDIYNNMVREWKIKSLAFQRVNDAKKIEEEIKRGNTFNEIAKKALEDGVAKGSDEGYLKDKDLKPAIARLVSTMEVGSVSPVVELGKMEFMIFRLEGMRFPDDRDPEVWERAQKQALKQKKTQAAKDYYLDLVERFVNLNDELFNSLDYESKEPGFERLLQDKRVIAEVSGEEPITVGELSRTMHKELYHGVERAIKNKSINRRKSRTMEYILQRRVLVKEALNQSIDKSEVYMNRVKKYENSIVFDTFVQKVIVPDIRLTGKELKDYYKKNADEFAYPEMIRMKGLTFRQRDDAARAMDALKKGADFHWLSSHAGGQLGKDAEGVSKFDGKPLSVRSLPEEARKSLSGAKAGESRLYEGPQGYYYVLYVLQLIPAKQQPLEAVRDEVAQKLYSDKIKNAVEAYAGKLREYYPVKIFAKDLR